MKTKNISTYSDRRWLPKACKMGGYMLCCQEPSLVFTRLGLLFPYYWIWIKAQRPLTTWLKNWTQSLANPLEPYPTAPLWRVLSASIPSSHWANAIRRLTSLVSKAIRRTGDLDPRIGMGKPSTRMNPAAQRVETRPSPLHITPPKPLQKSIQVGIMKRSPLVGSEGKGSLSLVPQYECNCKKVKPLKHYGRQRWSTNQTSSNCWVSTWGTW